MSDTETKPRLKVAMWLYFTAFALNVIGFVINDLQDDIQGMIFTGFSATLWYACASKEQATK